MYNKNESGSITLTDDVFLPTSSQAKQVIILNHFENNFTIFVNGLNSDIIELFFDLTIISYICPYCRRNIFVITFILYKR